MEKLYREVISKCCRTNKLELAHWNIAQQLECIHKEIQSNWANKDKSSSAKS